MNNNRAIYNAFNTIKPSIEQLLPENEYEPLETLKIARTIVPTNRTTYNETWKHIYNQLKLK